MKNTLRRRTFISAIAMLLVSAIVLTSSTFAWFSMAKRVEVETMELNITSPDGVQLSANTNAFTTKLTLADLKGESSARWNAYEGHKNNFPELISPSSSNFNLNNSLPSFFAGSISDKGLVSASAVSDVGSGYVAFDLFVKVGQNMKVYWDKTTVTCADNEDVISAMRVALVNCGPVAAKAEADAIQAVRPTNVEDNRAVMYEPYSTNHTDASGYADGTSAPSVYVYKAFSDLSPQGNGNNIIMYSGYAEASKAVTVTDDTKAENAYFNAVAGINRVRVYLWMEGNDVDCANDVAGATINFDLVLTIV